MSLTKDSNVVSLTPPLLLSLIWWHFEYRAGVCIRKCSYKITENKLSKHFTKRFKIFPYLFINKLNFLCHFLCADDETSPIKLIHLFNVCIIYNHIAKLWFQSTSLGLRQARRLDCLAPTENMLKVYLPRTQRPIINSGIKVVDNNLVITYSALFSN